MYNQCQKYSNILQIDMLDCYRYRLVARDIGLGLSSHPWPTIDSGDEMSALNIVLQKNSLRKLLDELSNGRVVHVRFAKGRLFQVRSALWTNFLWGQFSLYGVDVPKMRA